MHRDHDTLDLGGGIPDLSLFPSDKLAEIAARVVHDNATNALQYAPTEGLTALRGFIADRLNQRGCQISTEQVIITHGSQQALAAAASLLTGPTRPVAVEQPGYPGALQAFSLAQAPILPLPITGTGWDLEPLRDARAAALYVIPNFQNPTGQRASLDACLSLLHHHERARTFLIEDDAYGELGFETPSTRPLLADARTRGLLLGTFSKTLCPGMRVGWLVAPHALVGPSVRVLQALSLQPGTLAQHLAWELIQNMDYDAHLARLHDTYRARAKALRAHCERLGLHSEEPGGGLFLWVRTAENASGVARLAATKGVFSVPEAGFRRPLHPGADCHLRLAYSRYLDLPTQRERLTGAFASKQPENVS